MPKSTDIRILEVHCSFEPYKFRTPLSFGGRVQDGSELINVEIKVEARNGKHAIGFGSMPLGNVWAWPSATITPEQSAAAIKQFAKELVDIAEDFTEYAHPLETMYRISGEYAHLGQKISRQMKLAEGMPLLAEMVAASPFDAALHDAFGRTHGKNSYDLLGKDFIQTDLSEYLDKSFAGEYLDRYTLREPKARMPLYHLVGALDPLTPQDVQQKVGDRLPECLADWIATEGLTHLKIKLGSGDLQQDLQRTLAVDQVASEALAKKNVTNWSYSLDFNEKCPDVQYLLDFLKQLETSNPAAYNRIQYIEQPTHRDLKSHPEQTVHAAAKLKPIVIDESLTDYETLLLSREMGYTGVALKACKGHSDALLIAAAAQKMGLFLCVQDLTCPGFSFLHSASLAARIPTVAAIEGNARQYSPAMNRQWRSRFPGMFDIKDGTVKTSVLNGVGLGFD